MRAKKFGGMVFVFGMFGTLSSARAVSSPSGTTSEPVPIQQMAQGQALTGSTLLNDSLYANPAASAFTSAYSVDGTFFFPRAMAVSVLDTKTSSVGGALGYFRLPTDTSTSQFTQGAKGALFGRMSSLLGVGVAGKLIWGPPTLGPDHKMTDFDTGMIMNLNPMQLGFTVRNLFGGNQALEEKREWSLGAQWNYDQQIFVSFASNSYWTNIKPYQYGVGLQYVSPYYFAIKGGYRLLPTDHLSFWSAGASFISPRLSIHYSAEFPVQSGQSVAHVIGTTLLL